MNRDESSDKKAILQLIRRINELWRNRQYENIGRHLSDDVCIAPPGYEGRIRGREAYVESYRRYDQSAQTLEFSPGEPEVDIMGDTAVALCPFFVVYTLDEQTFRENGRDILVLSREKDGWRIVWRTMQAQSAD